MARIKLGPWGHVLGDPKQVFDHSGYDGIKSIAVTRSDYGIHRLRFRYIQRGIADPVVLEVGGTGGSRTDEMELDYPREYLVEMFGVYSASDDKPIIQELFLLSTQGDFGSIGRCSGEDTIEIAMKGAKIVGFHGEVGQFVSRLGVYIEPCGAPSPTTIVPRNSGPWGGGGGDQWDDGVNTRINKVVVYVDGTVLLSLHAFYEFGGSSRSSLHPGKTGETSSTVEFKKENDEHLERISGFFGPSESDPKTVIVKALRFHSNKATYGPYGDETGMGEFFSSSTDKGEILGFYGRCRESLYAIGVHIKYKTQTPEH